MLQPESGTQPVFDNAKIDHLSALVTQGDKSAALELIEKAKPLIEITAVSAYEFGFDQGTYQRQLEKGLSESAETQMREWRSDVTKRMDELTGEQHEGDWYAAEVTSDRPLDPGITAVFGIATAMQSGIIDPSNPRYLRPTPGYERAKFEDVRNYVPSEDVIGLLNQSGKFEVSVAKATDAYVASQKVVQNVTDGMPILEPEVATYLEFIKDNGLADQTITNTKILHGSFKRPTYNVILLEG